MEKQIEEMAVENLVAFLWHNTAMYDEDLIFDVAEAIYNAGYRKQGEGHWITHDDYYECSECGEEIEVDNPKGYDPVSDYDFRFCYHCGAKMKGADNGKSD